MLTVNPTSPEKDKKKVLHSRLRKSNFGSEAIGMSSDKVISTTSSVAHPHTGLGLPQAGRTQVSSVLLTSLENIP